jgi:ribonuclease R
VTIDGEDARDFDDAVYCERRAGGWRLLVAIADVSHYVAPGSALDQEARNRGNSVYFPDRVIPMLPEILSNQLCSLNPQVDRLCLVCDLSLDPRGQVRYFQFREAVMRSRARLTYTEVNALVVERKHALRTRYQTLVPHLDDLYALYTCLKERREARGAIDFDTPETRILFSKERKIERIVPLIRNDAHRLIEECMITANVAAAEFLLSHKIPCLYRVHDRPEPQKLEDLRAFLGELGLSLSGGDKPDARDYADLLARISHRQDAHLIQTVLLRSFKLAVYSPDNIGHFGLAFDAYTHFTSPIRRYPDLLVHRAIRHLLAQGTAEGFIYERTEMQALGEHCSMTERRADEATRDVINWLKCEYMLDKVGEVFEGIISAVTAFGFFVELKDIYVEGLVHVTSLASDYYHFDPIGHRLRGERTGRVYRLANRVKVRVMRVDLDERKIDFALVD